jgi:hypothetical protein
MKTGEAFENQFQPATYCSVNDPYMDPGRRYKLRDNRPATAGAKRTRGNSS